jgi:DNA-binding transcriptional ArsR family regulator
MAEFDPILFAKALADETRQKIMKTCCCRWLSVTKIVEQLSVTQPTVSHHLAILREAGLVNVREEGKQTFYRLDQRRITLCCGRLRANFESARGNAKS